MAVPMAPEYLKSRFVGRSMACLKAAARPFAFAAAAVFSVSAAEQKEASWDWELYLRGGGGYKDNVLLSDINKESSVFTLTEVEAFVFRLPGDDGWEVTGLAAFEDRRF